MGVRSTVGLAAPGLRRAAPHGARAERDAPHGAVQRPPEPDASADRRVRGAVLVFERDGAPARAVATRRRVGAQLRPPEGAGLRARPADERELRALCAPGRDAVPARAGRALVAAARFPGRGALCQRVLEAASVQDRPLPVPPAPPRSARLPRRHVPALADVARGVAVPARGAARRADRRHAHAGRQRGAPLVRRAARRRTARRVGAPAPARKNNLMRKKRKAVTGHSKNAFKQI